MEVKRLLLFLLVLKSITVECYLLGLLGICSGECINNRCYRIQNNEVVPCTPGGYTYSLIYNGNKRCSTTCKAVSTDTWPMCLAEGMEYEQWCSLHHDYEIWDYNFYRIIPNGLLFPVGDFQHANEVSHCAYVGREVASVYVNCSRHIDNVADPKSTNTRLCQRKCDVGICKHQTQITYQCAAFLPNYLFLGPKPTNFDGKLTATKHLKYKTVTLPDFGLPPFTVSDYKTIREKDYCKNGLMQIEGETLSLAAESLRTDSFHCTVREPARWVVLIAKVIVIDKSLTIYGIRKFILAAPRIEVKGNFEMTLRGLDVSEANSGDTTWTPHWRPDLAKGNFAGKIIVITTQWTLESSGQIRFSSVGGDGSCGNVPKFHTTQPISQNQLKVGGEQYISIEFDRPYQEMAYEYMHYYPGPVCRGNYGVRFHVYSAVDVRENEGGLAESPKLFGVKSEQEHLITTHVQNGQQHTCDQTIETDPIAPQFEVMYAGDCGFYVREQTHVAWYFRSLEEKSYYERKYNASDDRYMKNLTYATYKLIGNWDSRDQVKFLMVLTEAFAWTNTNWKEYYYLALRYTITNSKEIEDDLEMELLGALRDGLLRNWDPSDEFQKWSYATIALQERRVNSETSFIIRLLKFVTDKKEVLKTLYTTEERTKLIDAAANEYDKFNDDKIKVAEEVLKDDVMPALDEIKQKLNKKFGQLKKEIEVLIKQAEEKRDTLRENLKNAERAQITNRVLNAFSIFGSLLSFLGPVAGAVGGVINAGVNLGKTINEEVNKPQTPAGYKMPDSVRRDMDVVVTWIDTKQNRLEAKIESIIKTVGEVDTLASFLNFLTRNLAELRSIKPKHQQYGIIKKVEKNVKGELEKLNSELKGTAPESRKGEDDVEKEEKEAQKNAAVINAAGGTFSSVDTFMKDELKGDENIANIKEDIDAVNNDLKALREFAEKVYEIIIPMTVELMQTFDYVTLEMNDTNLARIDATQWNMQSNIDDIKHEFKKVLKDFESGPDIIHAIDKIGKLLEIMSTIFSQIATIKDQKINAAFQKNLASASTFDPVHQEFVKNMDTEMTNAVVRSEVTTVYNAFRQWSFPFVTVFMGTLPEFQLGGWNVDSNATTQEALNIMTKVVETIGNYESILEATVDKFKQGGAFVEDPRRGHRAFYTWNHVDFGDKIYSLLSGNEVFFTADIAKLILAGGHADKQAIKFSAIGISFRVKRNRVLAQELNSLLEAYKFILVHMGYSYYNFDGKIYLFTCQQLTFMRSFDHSTSNFAAKKAENADAVLSPYGIWKFALQANGQHDFSELIELLEQNPEIELDLIGDGTYVGDVRGERFRDPLVEKYFKPIDEVVLPEPQNRDRYL